MHGGMEGKVTMWPWDVSGLGCTGMAPADLISRDSPMYLETLLLRASGGLVIHRTNFWNLCSKPGFPIVLSRIQRLLKEVPRATYYGLELSPFYRLNIGVPSNWHVETLLPNEMTWGGGAFGTCLGPKGGALINETGVFVKETPQSSLAPSTMFGQRRSRWLWTTKRVLTRKRPCWWLGLRLPASGIANSTFLLFISLPVCSTFLSQSHGLWQSSCSLQSSSATSWKVMKTWGFLDHLLLMFIFRLNIAFTVLNQGS